MNNDGWKYELITGIKIIDDQHKRIFQILNNLEEAIHVVNGPRILLFILDDLLEYSYYHIETEESILKAKHDYDFASHKKVHDEIIRIICMIKDDLSEKNIFPTINTVGKFKNWWISHIIEEDLKAIR